MERQCGPCKTKLGLTGGKVDMLGDLVPGTVVEMADLLLVLHHVGRLAPLLVLHGDVVLDRLKVLPVLGEQEGVGGVGDGVAGAGGWTTASNRQTSRERVTQSSFFV